MPLTGHFYLLGNKLIQQKTCHYLFYQIVANLFRTIQLNLLFGNFVG